MIAQELACELANIVSVTYR